MTGTTLVLGAAELASALGQPPPTEEQVAVIEAPLESGLVVAGAGSGKTETMASRVVWLIATGAVRAEQVLGLTFTRKAAGELGGRIRSRLRQLAALHLVESDPLQFGEPTVSTYHSYAARLVAEHGLRLGVEPGSRLITEAVRWQHAAAVVSAYGGDMRHVEFVPATVIEEVLDLAAELAEHLVDPEELRAHAAEIVARVEGLAPAKSSLPGGVYAEVRKMLDRQLARLQLLPLVEQFEARKRATESMDYSDQLAVAARLAAKFPEIGRQERGRFGAVLLDEYQDTSHAQLSLLQHLFGGGHPVTAVGDPCQSIYGWRGASAGGLIRFPEHFPRAAGRVGVQQLSTSWRNDERILDLANVIAQPLRDDRAPVPVLRAAPAGEGRGLVRCALLANAEDEAEWLAERLGDVWRGNDDRAARGERPKTAAVLTRRRSQQRTLETALRARGLPVEVLGLGGLLDTPEVLDLVSTLRIAVDPTAGDAMVRLLTGARWRLGPRDLAALGRRAKALAGPRDTAAGPPVPLDDSEQGSLVDAVDDPGPPSAYSALGWGRIWALRTEVRALRRRLDQPLPDLLADVERTIGLDVEVAVRRPHEQALARGHLDAFLGVAADFATGSDRVTLTAFLSFLRAAQEQERGLEAGVVERRSDAVQILTVHGAKGLEWDVVAVPGLTKGVFPAKDRAEDLWLTKLGAVPYQLRGDRADLPQLDFSGCSDQKDADTAREQFRERCAEIADLEERRLAYVAVTRARSEVLCSGYWFDDTKTARGPSPLLTHIERHCAAGHGEIDAWEPSPDSVNPRSATRRQASWPYDPLGVSRRAVDAAAELVRAAPPEPAAESDEWGSDVALLLTERAGWRGGPPPVELPSTVSVSELVLLRRDPEALAARLRRPMPFPPAPLARRGTAFHAWLEHRFGRQRLLDLDELPGAGDADSDDRDLVELQGAFLASEWAERTPIEVEIPFECRIGAVAVRGRMDAVFRATDGRFEVVDWKTGRPPDGDDAVAAAVQLAAYRLAWAELAGVSSARVSAAFHYVRYGITVRPADLPDADGLRRIVEAVPMASAAPAAHRGVPN